MRHFAFVLAHRLGCTLRELGQRISASEFAEWMAFYAMEGLHPSAARMRHAQVLAGMANGALVRVDQRHWSATDFMPSADDAAEDSDTEATEPDLEAHARLHNTRMAR